MESKALYTHNYYIRNKEKILKRIHSYIQKRKSHYRELYRKYRLKNRVKRNEYTKRYKIANKEKIKVYNRMYIKKYRKNINNKIKSYLVSRIWWVLKKNTKSESTLKLLGCSVEFLKNHLEKQFTKGMSWNNYGKWHIDHIRPCASFDLSKPEEQKKCFNYSNLQPLWAKDNLSKGAR